jgi:putative tricarboxylic transport membrane protein
MARQGRAGPALGLVAFGSFIAGIFGIILLAFFAPPLANVALDFGPPEYFSLVILGMTLLIYLGSGSILKSIITAGFGLILGCVGQDPIFGKPRLTFGIEVLRDGVELIAAVMGLFGIPEVLENIERPEKRDIFEAEIKGLLPSRQDWRASAKPIIRGSMLGFFLGVLPGGGSVISSFASYAIEKKFSKHPEAFGKGAIEGVAGPESANNSASMGAMVPLLTLGIPGNAVTALLLAALLVHGIRPGPLLITNHPELFWGIIMSMFFGNLLLLALNLPLIRLWVQVLKVPYHVLFPLILLFCLVGAYSVNMRETDILIMLAFGLIGYFFKKYGYESAPLLLAFILEPTMEMNFRQSLIISRGNFSIFLFRPYSLAFLLTAFLFLFLPLFSSFRRKKREIRIAGGEEV